MSENLDLRHADTAQDQSVGSLLKAVTTDLSTLMRQEVELAKVEMKQEASKAGKAGGMMGAAGVAALMLLVFASLALMFALDAAMPTGWAALIVAVLWAAVGGVLFALGRKKLADVNPKPERTIETVKEDVQWARNQSRSSATSS